MSWISQRALGIDASGIRKVFDLAASLKDPINLSIGQPHYDTPEPVKDAVCDAVRAGRNAYSPSQGIGPLLDRLQHDVNEEYGHADRKVFVTSGTSGGLMLSLAALVDPGDEVIAFDPYFVMYKHLVTLFGGKTVLIDTYPDFDIDLDKVAAAITPRTKAILCNSPSNPTGAVLSEATVRGLAELAAEKDVCLISDEIYRAFCYDGTFASPARWNDRTLVIDGFSKAWSMTGHRCGWAHGPKPLIEQMIKIQQYTFVCSPQPVQWGGLAALDVDVAGHVDDYRRKRDFMIGNLRELYDVRGAGGAFYLFIKAPWGTAAEFVEAALKKNLLVIPGNVFSERDTHFRVSYAADDSTLERGVEALKAIARP
ncbi:MAG: aminotransferase class I/II-fold pyridoxal phosphate-dependent enzyme [Planctomycetaceae bacterium]